MKILEVLSSEAVTNPILSELIKQCNFLSVLEVESKPFQELENFYDYLNNEGFSGCFLPLDLSSKFLQEFPRRNQLVQDLQCFDFIEWSSDNHFWPILLLHSHLKESLIRSILHLDMNGVGYVVGANKMATCAISVLIQLGMKKIRWIISDDDYLPSDLDMFQQKYFGAHLEIMSSTKLSLQNVDGSVLVSTLDYSDKPEILQDISYFNFIKQDSIVVDLHIPLDFQKRFESLLLKEAVEAQLPIFHRGEFLAGYFKDFFGRYHSFQENEIRAFRELFVDPSLKKQEGLDLK